MSDWIHDRLILRLVAMVSAVFCGGCYVTRQALTFNDMYNSRRSVEAVLQDPTTQPEVKDKLVTVKRVMAFADLEGLNVAQAYRYYIDNGNRSISYYVQAAEPDQLKSLTWWFPFVGTVPYLGYFAKNERDEKAAELQGAGFDVHVGVVGAFSSLGWFEDPIYGSMLDGGLAAIVHTLIHELTHRTFWSKGKVAMNENLAEYVAELLTIKYLTQNATSAEVARYVEEQSDAKLYRLWLLGLKDGLEALYSAQPKVERSQVLSKKQELFAQFLGAGLPRFSSGRYRQIASREWNNATVLASSLYAADFSRFSRAHQCLGQVSVGEFLLRLKRSEETHEDPFVALDSLCVPAHSEPA